MSLEICSFVVWSVWADQYWHLCFSWTWWHGGELEHQWRLNESAESEKLLRGCGCGPTGGGWFIHGVAGSSSVELWLYVLLREKWDLYALFCNIVVFDADGKTEQTCPLTNPSIFPLISKCIYIASPYPFVISHWIHYSIFFYCLLLFPPLRFFIPQRDLIMFWIKLHMWIMSEKCSMTNCRRWAQLAGNWATSSWRGLARVEIDGLMDRSGG